MSAGFIPHGYEHSRPTSYQSIQFEHQHAVPTYIKKEHQQLLDHPLPFGKTSSNIEVNHDYGYGSSNSDESKGSFDDQADLSANFNQQSDIGDHSFDGQQYGYGSNSDFNQDEGASASQNEDYSSAGQYQNDASSDHDSEGHQDY